MDPDNALPPSERVASPSVTRLRDRLGDIVYSNLDLIAVKLFEESLGRTMTGLMKHEVGLRTNEVQALRAPQASPDDLNKALSSSKNYFMAIVKEISATEKMELDEEEKLSRHLQALEPLVPIGGFSALSKLLITLQGPPARYSGILQIAYSFDVLIRKVTEIEAKEISGFSIRRSLKSLSLPQAPYLEPVRQDEITLSEEALDLGDQLTSKERRSLCILADNLYLSWLARLDIEFSAEQLCSVAPSPWLALLIPRIDQEKINRSRGQKRLPNGWYTHPNTRLINLCSCFSQKLLEGRWPDAPMPRKELIKLPGFAGNWRKSKAHPDNPTSTDRDPEKMITNWSQERNLDYGDFWDIWEGCCGAPALPSTPWPAFIAARFWALMLPKARLQKNPELVEDARQRYLKWWSYHLNEDKKAGRTFPGTAPQPQCLDLV